jgi:hypothetical protein
MPVFITERWYTQESTCEGSVLQIGAVDPSERRFSSSRPVTSRDELDCLDRPSVGFLRNDLLVAVFSLVVYLV